MVEGKPLFIVMVQVSRPCKALSASEPPAPFYRKGIVGYSKRIDVYRKKVALHQPANVFGKAGSQHHKGRVMIQGERILGQGNFRKQFHGMDSFDGQNQDKQNAAKRNGFS